ncbi:hypothetical protein B9G55_09345 [Saccharibacillus sp. O16]|nr:hypothetical protein B9G55_09345 [Saccharibacillus sp. O16]
MLEQRMGVSRSDLRLIGSMAFPLMLTQLIQVAFQFADQAIVGKLGVAEFAAVGVAGSFVFLITGTLGILCAAFNIVGGQYWGREDRQGFGQVFNVVMTLSVVIGLLFEVFILLEGRTVLRLIYGLEPSVLEPAGRYLDINALTLGINLVLFNFSTYFKNIKKAHLLIYSLSAASAVNVVMDYVLVFGKFGFPRLGIEGAAWGSVIGYMVSILISVMMFRKYRVFRFRFMLAKNTLKSLFRLYIPLALQDLVEYTLFAIALTAFVARLDVQLLAAYTVLTTLMELFMIPMYGFSGTCMTLSAQGFGKNQRDGFKYASLSCLMMGIVLTPLALLMIFFASPFAGLITDKPAVISIIHRLMPLVIVTGLINGLQMIFRATLQAVDSEKWVLYYSTLIYGISIVGIYLSVTHFALAGLYTGLGLCYGMLLISYVAKFRVRRARIHAAIQSA